MGEVLELLEALEGSDTLRKMSQKFNLRSTRSEKSLYCGGFEAEPVALSYRWSGSETVSLVLQYQRMGLLSIMSMNKNTPAVPTVLATGDGGAGLVTMSHLNVWVLGYGRVEMNDVRSPRWATQPFKQVRVQCWATVTRSTLKKISR